MNDEQIFESVGKHLAHLMDKKDTEQKRKIELDLAQATGAEESLNTLILRRVKSVMNEFDKGISGNHERFGKVNPEKVMAALVFSEKEREWFVDALTRLADLRSQIVVGNEAMKALQTHIT